MHKILKYTTHIEIFKKYIFKNIKITLASKIFVKCFILFFFKMNSFQINK